MARTKTKTTKKNTDTEENLTETPEEIGSEDGDIESFPIKAKKDPIIALDEHVEIEVPEEKVEEEIPVKIEDDEDLLSDEVSLDDEELNPFGDKWEE